MGNAALQDAYEPGSTAKVMSMAAVLEENAATPGTHVVVPNRLHRGDRLFKDDIDHPTWYLTLNGVLAKSSNIGTILATGQLGKTQRSPTRSSTRTCASSASAATPGSASPARPRASSPPPDKWSTSQQYTIPFGQGVSHQRDAGGLRLLDDRQRRRTRRTHPRTRHQGRPTAASPRRPKPKKTRVVSEKTAKTLAQMLESVVDDEEGTGTKARIPGYRVAGKTGTANRVDPATGSTAATPRRSPGSRPPTSPRITVYCAIQNATQGNYFGGQICGPIYKQVMEFALKTLQVPPTGAKAARLPVAFNPEARTLTDAPQHNQPGTARDNDHSRPREPDRRRPAPRFARGRVRPVRSPPCHTLISPKPPRRALP